MVKNKDQVMEFEMKDGEIWEKLQGKYIDFQAKLNDTSMSPSFHMKGHCHKKGKTVQ